MSDALNDQETIGSERKGDRKAVVITVVLWVIQVIAAAQFLIAGGFKLIGSNEILTQFYPGMPNMFMRFIAVCEILGALGLILPGIVRRWQWLTPLAALGLLVIMLGAMVYTVVTVGWGLIVSPLLLVILSAVVLYGRRAWGLDAIKRGRE
jgi:DoxX-like family